MMNVQRIVLMIWCLVMGSAWLSAQSFDKSFGDGGELVVECEQAFMQFSVDKENSIYTLVQETKKDGFNSDGSRYSIAEIKKYDSNGQRVKKFGKRKVIKERHWSNSRRSMNFAIQIIGNHLLLYDSGTPEWGVKVFDLNGKEVNHFKFDLGNKFFHPIRYTSGGSILLLCDKTIYQINQAEVITTIFEFDKNLKVSPLWRSDDGLKVWEWGLIDNENLFRLRDISLESPGLDTVLLEHSSVDCNLWLPDKVNGDFFIYQCEKDIKYRSFTSGDTSSVVLPRIRSPYEPSVFIKLHGKNCFVVPFVDKEKNIQKDPNDQFREWWILRR